MFYLRYTFFGLAVLVLGIASFEWLGRDHGGEVRSGATSSHGIPSPQTASASHSEAVTFLQTREELKLGDIASTKGPQASSHAPPPPPPNPILPGELSFFETISYPLGRPSYDGEPVTAYVRVGSLARDLALSVNQGGEYPRVPVVPGETVEIRLAFTDSPPDTAVALNAEDGGIVRVDGQGDRSVAGKLDEQRQLGLSYRVTGTTGVHRVALRTPDGETKVLEFWAGDPPVKKTLPSNPLRPRAFGGKGAEGMKKEIPSSLTLREPPHIC